MHDELLSKVLDSLRTKVSDFNYKNWFQNLQWDLESPQKVVLRVPSRFVRDWLTDHYLELIKFEFFRLTEKEHEISFKIEKNINRTLDLFAPQPAPQKSGPEQKQVAPQPKVINHFGFNSKYDFSNFVVGNSNQLVHAACQAVARQPARSYNPLYIYSGVGLGKTHLLNAIGIEALQQYPNMRVIYVTGERFTNEVINAIRYGKTYEMRKKYRDSCDLFLVDDIQFIAGKERTMEEFFHTFNALYEARKQIVLTSDQLPRHILNLEERLKSRFGWGLLADIQRPDYETRVAMLRKKADDNHIALPCDVCEYIASSVTESVRDLEGALVRVSAFASLAKMSVNMDLAQEVIKTIVTDNQPRLSVENIQDKVAEFYNLKISDLKSKRRHKNLAVPRQIAMYLCKTYLDASFLDVGQRFGGKDHSTVMHSVQKIKNCITTDPNIKADIDVLEKMIGL